MEIMDALLTPIIIRELNSTDERMSQEGCSLMYKKAKLDYVGKTNPKLDHETNTNQKSKMFLKQDGTLLPILPKPQYRSPSEDFSFDCNLCEKKFSTQPTLNFHVDLKHQADPRMRRYFCGIPGCLQMSSTNRDSKRHAMTHTGEQPYPCDVCGTPFRRKDNLIRHKNALHNKPKPVKKTVAELIKDRGYEFKHNFKNSNGKQSGIPNSISPGTDKVERSSNTRKVSASGNIDVSEDTHLLQPLNTSHVDRPLDNEEQKKIVNKVLSDMSLLRMKMANDNEIFPKKAALANDYKCMDAGTSASTRQIPSEQVFPMTIAPNQLENDKHQFEGLAMLASVAVAKRDEIFMEEICAKGKGERSIIIFGMSSLGKSYIGNCLVNLVDGYESKSKKAFLESSTPFAQLHANQTFTVKAGTKLFTIVDTLALSKGDQGETLSIVRPLESAGPIAAVLFVLLTDNEGNCSQCLQKIFQGVPPEHQGNIAIVNNIFTETSQEEAGKDADAIKHNVNSSKVKISHIKLNPTAEDIRRNFQDSFQFPVFSIAKSVFVIDPVGFM